MKSLFVKQFVDEGLGNSSYLIGSEETGLAAVIDPERDVDKYLQTADGLGLRLIYGLDTHLHADFVSGVHELMHHLILQHDHEHFQIGASATAGVEFQHIDLYEGDRLSLGNLSVGVMSTPGHSPEHISFGIYDEESRIPEVLFSGGSLIVGGTGRPDLLGHEHSTPLARDLYHTLHDKFAPLPDDVLVYPTHGAGSFCNTTTSSARFTTIGQERLANPFFQTQTEEEFVQRALTGLSSYPTYYRYMRDVNIKGGKVLGGVPVLNALTPDKVNEQMKAGTAVIDIRKTPDYLAGHIPNSYGIPLSTPLISWAGWVVPFGSPIILIADAPAQREEATRQLIRIGYDDLRGYLEGGIESWQAVGFPINKTKSVTASELNKWTTQKDAPLVLDVRHDKEWISGHMRGAQHIEAGSLFEKAESQLTNDRPIVVHCRSGKRSTVAISILEQKGYRNVYALEAGLQAWEKAGYEVVKDGN